MPTRSTELTQTPKRNAPHAQSTEEVIHSLQTSATLGLSDEEVQERRKKYGANRLPEQRARPLALIFLEQFLDPIIYLLMAAALLAFLFAEWIEGVAVAAVILITALIGFFMEWQAVRSMESLQQMAQAMARVLRGGKKCSLKALDLVPGDVILLEMGDVVPADLRILEHENLAVKEAALTGESGQVEKDTAPLEEDCPLAERRNMAYKGTLITRGTAKGVATATGERTELGKISKMAQRATKQATPLEKRLNQLSKKLIWLTLLLAALIAATGYLQGKSLLLMIETAIALAVASIPEGLPIVATIALARGMLRLAKKSVIIKKLEAVQTLGEVGIICTDKTGTLTENQMAVHSFVIDGQILSFKEEEKEALLEKWKPCEAFDKIVKAGILCSNASLHPDGNRGDPVEIALAVFAKEAGYDVKAIRASQPEVLEIPFDTETKLMATVNRAGKRHWVWVKGAPENVLRHCTFQFTNGRQEPLKEVTTWLKKADELATDGLRNLAFAISQHEKVPAAQECFQDLTFLGIAGFLDPPRKEVRSAIEACRRAGIRIVMASGDHPQTARKVAEETGLLREDAPAEAVVQGGNLTALRAMTEEQKKQLLQATVFGRVTPATKLGLVSLYQENNFIVAMTGDGVNDAPALKKADIGIAMGIRGTEAAKEVADIILRDDRFSSIELAIRQGRIIFENIRKFVVYLLSSNLAEIISVALASLLNLPLPLLPLQILFLNLVTDVFPSLALGMGEGDEDIMSRPPRDPQEPIMPRHLWTTTVLYGLAITAGVLGITFYGSVILNLPDEQANNLAFYTLVMAQLLNVFNLPDRQQSFLVNEVTRNPWVWGAIVLCLLITAMGYFLLPLREVLSLVPLRPEQLGLVALFSLGALGLAQALKRLGLAV